MSGQLRFEVLGPVRAWLGAAEVELGTPQQRAILGILLLRNGGVAMPEQLVAAIWGVTAPRAAGSTVRTYVSRLRRALGPVIESVGGGYALPTEPGTLDVTDFERLVNAAREARHTGDLTAEANLLRAALALWKGTPLAGVRGEYAEQERARLMQLRLAAVEDLAAADLELGRHAEAEAGLVPLVIEQPLRERPRELLMLALYRSGRQAEALAVYQEAQRLLSGELGLDPGPELREMQRRILKSDPSLAGPMAVHQPPAPQLVEPPMQLPPDLPAYTGRSGIAEEMVKALVPSATHVPMIGLTGVPGVGKTALAVHVGHQLAAQFPDGQFFADMAWPGKPMSGLLRGMGVPAGEVPDSLSERSALWRSLTADRKVLLVMDDVQDLERVKLLMPGPGGPVVILTSRQRWIGLPHVRWLKVDGLPEDESLALLETLVGAARVRAELADASRLAELTSGLPQVLHAIGARLASRPGWSLATAAQRLGRRQLEPQVIEGPYQTAMKALTPEQARAFRLLAVPDGPDITIPAAAAVLGLSIDDTAVLLDSLADVHLLEPGTSERYSFLGPVRAFARGRALTEDGEACCHEALVRLAKFYVATVRNASMECSPDPAGLTFENVDAAQAWLADSQEHLWTITAQTTGIPDAPADELAKVISSAWSEPVVQ
ncbi:BTAD domain-containing putative transcriptional regulator [Actinocrispum sp. NPDC049592]|uniref:AfsR/SARP family transcriptional regulator n=1 Tax=Actinocrispum sp. NPDC049592 TaxID=3154835 RepID=UPI00343339B3